MAIDPCKSQVEEMVEAFLAPSHPDTLEALLDEPFAGTFDDPAANGQSQFFESGIIDMVTMFFQVIEGWT